MKKSKEFIVEREKVGLFSSPLWAVLKHPINGKIAYGFCYRQFCKFFGITLAPGERKRVKITIEEVEK